ncbi:cation diffusion facilitator family transporter [Xenococcus sp. PCC 7305]|uniref:cation diffusion facilitator family transporter n=1 Tax=Xenococcus sp. PCC 7305 TaxID=102125 RepID=UPI0002ACA281|nr:cation diffusion facilitator family transporter [Xenococcus sp. PCC 7305]ELS05090.1 cation diffusion facilitator family transporter [Xenococcus sp. PCC 7305]
MAYFWHSCSLPNCNNSFQQSASQQWRLGAVLIGILGFAAVEWVTGYFCHSLALQSDAWHMVGDAGAILIALSATSLMRLALIRRLPKKLQLDAIAAVINAIALILMAGLILGESIQHWQHPPQEILSTPMLITAMIGLGVNIIGVRLLHEDSQTNINIRGAFLHMMADLVSSVGVIISAVAIAVFQCFWLDNLISLLIALFIGQSAFPLLQLVWKQWHQKTPSLELLLPEIGQTSLSEIISEKSII